MSACGAPSQTLSPPSRACHGRLPLTRAPPPPPPFLQPGHRHCLPRARATVQALKRAGAPADRKQHQRPRRLRVRLTHAQQRQQRDQVRCAALRRAAAAPPQAACSAVHLALMARALPPAAAAAGRQAGRQAGRHSSDAGPFCPGPAAGRPTTRPSAPAPRRLAPRCSSSTGGSRPTPAWLTSTYPARPLPPGSERPFQAAARPPLRLGHACAAPANHTNTHGSTAKHSIAQRSTNGG